MKRIWYILPVTRNLYLVPWNILHVIWGVICSRNILSFTGKMYCDIRCSILFLSKEIGFLSQEIFFLSQILYSFCHRKYSSYYRKFFLWHVYILSCDRICSSFFKEYCVRQMENIFRHKNNFSCYFVTRRIFPARQRNYSFLWHKVKSFK